MQQSTLQYLADHLAAHGVVGVYPTRQERFSGSVLSRKKGANWLEEVYTELGGRGNYREIAFTLPEGVETETVRLALDGPLQFNRYRATTLQSEFYQLHEPAWLASYRRHCRSAERECLKAGSRKGIWTSGEAEKHFGQPQEPGDFFGVGSPGWRLGAFKDFMADFYLLTARQKHERVALYDRLMIQGQLFPLQQLLQSRREENLPYLLQFMSRKLEQPQPRKPAVE